MTYDVIGAGLGERAENREIECCPGNFPEFRKNFIRSYVHPVTVTFANPVEAVPILLVFLGAGYFCIYLFVRNVRVSPS